MVDTDTANFKVSRRILIGSAAAAILYGLLFSALLIVRPFDESTIVFLDDVGGLPASYLASFLLLLASFNTTTNIRKAWQSLAIGVLAWAIGDTIWAVYELGAGQEAPFPSVADVFYLAGYGFLFVGVVSFSYREGSRVGLRTALDASALTLAGAALIWRIAIEPILTDSSAGTLDKVLSGLYPVGDIVVLFALMLAIFRHRDGKAGVVFGVFTAGMVVVLVADVAFAYLDNKGLYQSGSLIDAGWIIGFLLMGYAGLLQLGWRPEYTTDVDDLSDPAWKQGLPLFVMTAVLTWTVLEGLGGGTEHLPLIGAILTMMCLVVIRHFLTLHENIRLRRNLELAFTVEQLRARTDPLTGVLNRRAILEAFTEEFVGIDKPVCAIGMVDLDAMKRINDRYGHQAGDEALLAVAAALGPKNRVGRYGGDEFLVILAGADESAIESFRTEVRSSLAAWSASRADGVDLSVSIGFAFMPSDGCDVTELIALADRRMYEVKSQRYGIESGRTAPAA